jgi:NitT/TauT family transport system substrate-binding protein
MKYSQRNWNFSTILLILMILALGGGCKKIEASKPASNALKIGYSDWPGWIAFEIGIQKGWFKEAGVDTQFEWFDYAVSMQSFAAGNLDAVMMTMGDALVTGAAGARSVCILVTDYSSGNDMIVADPVSAA